MPKYATLEAHLSLDELAHRHRKTVDPVERSHFHIIWLLAQGKRVWWPTLNGSTCPYLILRIGGGNMNTLFEGRESDSPYIEAVWRGWAGSDYAPVCPASDRWHLFFLKQHGRVNVSVEGPLTKATPVTQAEGTSWFGITFPLGTFLPAVPIRNLLDERAMLSLAAKSSFELAGSRFQFPDYDNVETFVERLVREDLLVSDEMVKAVLAGHPPEMSLRTVRRRFLFATGLPYKVISQIERAKQAADLLERGVSLLDAAYQAGYADQSHMTRSLKHFIGYTPAHIARLGNGRASE